MSEARPLQRLAELGQSVWIDYLSRDLLTSGELERLIREDAVVGVTSNPTIFEKAIAHGDAYDEQLRELLPRQSDAKEVFLELACADVAAACDVFRPVWEQTAGETDMSRSKSTRTSLMTRTRSTRRRNGCTRRLNARICS